MCVCLSVCQSVGLSVDQSSDWSVGLSFDHLVCLSIDQAVTDHWIRLFSHPILICIFMIQYVNISSDWFRKSFSRQWGEIQTRNKLQWNFERTMTTEVTDSQLTHSYNTIRILHTTNTAKKLIKQKRPCSGSSWVLRSRQKCEDWFLKKDVRNFSFRNLAGDRENKVFPKWKGNSVNSGILQNRWSMN